MTCTSNYGTFLLLAASSLPSVSNDSRIAMPNPTNSEAVKRRNLSLISGDKNLVLQALLAHPWPFSISQAEKIRNELFSAHAAFLPQFQQNKE